MNRSPLTVHCSQLTSSFPFVLKRCTLPRFLSVYRKAFLIEKNLTWQEGFL